MRLFWKATYGSPLAKTSENSGNCHIVGTCQITMSPIELLKCCYLFSFLIPLAQQLCSEHFPTLY